MSPNWRQNAIITLTSFILGLIAGLGVSCFIHRPQTRHKKEEPGEPPDREGWIAGQLECLLCRAKSKRLDVLLGFSDNSSKIDSFIALRLLASVVLLLVFASTYGSPFPDLNVHPPVAIAITVFVLVLIGLCGTGPSASILVVLLIVGGFAQNAFVPRGSTDSAKAHMVLFFTSVSFVLLLDMIVARARDHLFQLYRKPEEFYPPRSLALAIISFVETILVYALFYSAIAVLSRDAFRLDSYPEERAVKDVWQALWFSLTTMISADSGITYSGWARVCAATQLLVGLFFFVVILATLVNYLASGASHRERVGGCQVADDGHVEE